MVNQNAEAEALFAAKFDCRFPYLEKAAAKAVIDEGWKLSADAAFGVLHEICRKPRYAKVTRKRQLELIDEWLAGGSHPLQDWIAQCARALVEKRHLPWQQAVSVMEAVASYPRQYAALNIAYFSGDCDGEGDAHLQAAHNRITRAWA
jgi:hypothetical protein